MGPRLQKRATWQAVFGAKGDGYKGLTFGPKVANRGKSRFGTRALAGEIGGIGLEAGFMVPVADRNSLKSFIGRPGELPG